MNNQLKLCPGYCCIQNQTFTKTDRIIYLNNIKNLKNFFTFKNQAFLKTLYSQIDKLIKNQELKYQIQKTLLKTRTKNDRTLFPY